MVFGTNIAALIDRGRVILGYNFLENHVILSIFIHRFVQASAGQVEECSYFLGFEWEKKNNIVLCCKKS